MDRSGNLPLTLLHVSQRQLRLALSQLEKPVWDNEKFLKGAKL
jgi:hypothetical protein